MTRDDQRDLLKDVFFPMIARDLRESREEAVANREFHRRKEYEYVPTVCGHVSVLELDREPNSKP